jgi:hypothetical protein
MAENHIPRQSPAPAFFASASYSGPVEPFFDSSVEVVDQDIEYLLGADTSLPELTVVHVDVKNKTVVAATVTAGVANGNAILAAPLVGLSGATGRIPIHTSGHWSTLGILYDASFTTTALKEQAFPLGSPLRASTPKFSNDAIDIPN